jgi:hypothetical protein
MRISRERNGVFVRLTILALAFSPVLAGPGFAQEGRGSIRGVLYQSDGDTPIAGAKAHAVQVDTKAHFESALTSRNGAWEITGLPRGSFDLAFEVDGTVFVVESLIDLASGQSVTTSFSVQPEKPAARSVPGLGAARGSALPLESLTPPLTASFWKSPVGQALLWILGAGGAVAVANAADDGDGSPSTP